MANPFNEEGSRYLVVINDFMQYSPSLMFMEMPLERAGDLWSAGLDYIARNRNDPPPTGLAVELAGV